MIVKEITAPNGARVSVHKLIRFESDGPASGSVLLTVGSWADTESILAQHQPLWTWRLTASLGHLMSPNPFGSLELALANDGPFAGGLVEETPDGDSLEAVKARRNADINAWRLIANRGYFMFQGKQIDCDELSRSDISGMNDEVSLTGELPADFPGAWKCRDNTYLPIPDVATWRQLIQAMVSQGAANFARAQMLKQLVQQADTIAKVMAISWETNPPEAEPAP